MTRTTRLAATMRMLALLAFVSISGCDSAGSGEVSPEYVVEAYLIADQPLRRVLLSRTTAINAPYEFADLAIRDAEVRLNRINTNGSVDETYEYEYRGLAYSPLRDDVVVQAGARYELIVTAANGDQVTAETVVPGAFQLLRVSEDSVQYQGPIQIEATVSRSAYKVRSAIYVFSIESLDPRMEMLTPLYDQFVDNESDLEQIRITESPPFNEQNYDINADGSLTIALPWIAVAFYGPTEVTANAIDDNLYDFLRSQSIQQGGGTFAPGEIPNIITSIKGGTGVFGSMASASYRAYISR